MEGKPSESSLFVFSSTGQDRKKSEESGTEAQSSGPEVDRVTQLMAKSSMDDSLGVVRTVADLISAKLAAVLDFIQAIRRSHRSKHRLENAQEDPVDKLSLCICNRVDCIEVCDVRQWLPDSKFYPKVSDLVYQLEESYLALGEAYKEGQQLDQSLKVVKVACLLYDSIPQHLKDERFSSSCQLSASCDRIARDEAKDEQFPRAYLFWAKAWWLVGDVYAGYHRKERSSTSVAELPICNRVTELMEQYKTNLNFNPRTTQVDSSSDCGNERISSHTGASTSSTGDYSTRKKSSRLTKKSKRKFDGNSSETNNNVETDYTAAADNPPSVVMLRCGGIAEFLGGIQFVNAVEDLILAAIACYEAARKAIGVGESSSEFLSVVMKKKGLACNELGYHRLENRDFSGAGIAFMDAERALEEVSDNVTLVQVYCGLGLARGTFADKLVAIMDLHETELNFPAVRKQYLDLAKSLQLEALMYYGTAKRKLLPLPAGDSNLLHDEVSKGSSITSQKFQMLLAKANIPNKGQRKKHDRSDFSHRRALYKVSGFERTNFDHSAPGTHPAMYLKMLLELSDISLCLSNTFDSNAMKKVALQHLLEGRNITKAKGDRKLCHDHHVRKEFWKQLQDLLETMLSAACLVSGDGADGAKDSKKLEAMRRMSSKSPTFSQLHEMHKLWFS